MADQGSVCSGDAAASAGRRSFPTQNAAPATAIAAKAMANQKSGVLGAASGTPAGIPAIGIAESMDGAAAGFAVSAAFSGGAATGGATLCISGIYEPGGSSMRKSDWGPNST